jgi:hypothetical protein
LIIFEYIIALFVFNPNFMTMKHLKYLFFAVMLSSLYFVSGCDNGDGPGPSTSVFNLTAATFNGTAISPLPTYSLTIRFNAEGQPDGFSAMGNATYAPTPVVTGSGTWTATGTAITFTSGSASRTATANATLTPTTSSVSLTFSLTKVDDGVPAADAGTYVYTFQKQ